MSRERLCLCSFGRSIAGNRRQQQWVPHHAPELAPKRCDLVVKLSGLEAWSSEVCEAATGVHLLTPPSGEEQVCVVRDGSQRRTRAGSTISREGLRRLSRMLPANHEQLIHLRLKDKESLSEVNAGSQGNLLDVKTRL
ncbi:hypothetical protein ANCDUO_01587 [Ancylostoma duodenale]|uniref:Uncharacterized protein n=1 Tax=Ancylostoma duodenale TaxID=51022 RepID=A0A0C2H2R4_9BILA|nr:hypothetical protein ANCDUO_01587 [Ancylostoma duodenale]